MAEMWNVHDLFHPSPAPLRDISSIHIALALWRQEIIKRRTNNTLHELNPRLKLSLNTTISNAPPQILLLIEKSILKVGKSIANFIRRLSWKQIIDFEILNDFVDFVCDFDGSIHEEKTAKRVVLCDKVSDDVKFKVACWYCFEDDIMRIWPSVSSRMKLKNDDLLNFAHNHIQLFYWICRLKNQLYKVRICSHASDDMDECVLFALMRFGCGNYSSIKYFWNRLGFDVVIKLTLSHYARWCGCSEFVVRYLLTELDEEQLDEFLDKKCGELFAYLTSAWNKMPGIMPLWKLIENKIDTTRFIRLVRMILNTRKNPDDRYAIEIEEDSPFWLELWANAPDHLKQSVIPDVLLSERLFRRASFSISYVGVNTQISFLCALLQETSVEDRVKFWNAQWRDLILEFNAKQMRRLVDLCFINEDEFRQFKEINFSNHGNLRELSKLLLQNGRLEELEELLSFFCPNEQSAKNLRLNLLNNNFNIRAKLVAKARLLNKFIEDAHDDISLANEFKNQLVFSRNIPNSLVERMKSSGFQIIRKFVDALALSEEIIVRVKKEVILPLIGSVLTTKKPHFIRCNEDLEVFMKWCLGDDVAVAEYKQQHNMDTLIQDLILHELIPDRLDGYHEGVEDEYGRYVKGVKECDSFLVKFMEWYFVTPEAFAEFKKKYEDDEIFLKLITDQKKETEIHIHL